MWHIFRCFNCGLGFVVGGLLNRHTFEWLTFLVCSSCGTCHRITCPSERSRRKGGPSSCTLEAHGGPILLTNQTRSIWSRFLAGTRSFDWQTGFQRRYYRESKWILCSNLPGPRGAYRGPERTEQLTCWRCHKRGTLVYRWDRDNHICPNCHQDTLKPISSAIT